MSTVYNKLLSAPHRGCVSHERKCRTDDGPLAVFIQKTMPNITSADDTAEPVNRYLHKSPRSMSQILFTWIRMILATKIPK